MERDTCVRRLLTPEVNGGQEGADRIAVGLACHGTADARPAPPAASVLSCPT
ncbi:hypothetical protein [Streptomyces sp. RK9]|uniref:hypothetical protein n=1 Tax=Streptomyces sp. RK9 TaxID=3239284 RepID=UPI0038654983